MKEKIPQGRICPVLREKKLRKHIDEFDFHEGMEGAQEEGSMGTDMRIVGSTGSTLLEPNQGK